MAQAPLGLDASEAFSTLDELEERLNALTSVTVTVEATGVDEIASEVEAISVDPVEVQVDADSAQAEADLQEVGDLADYISGLSVDIDAQADTGSAQADLDAVAGAAEEASGPVSVPVDAPGASEAAAEVGGVSDAVGELQGLASGIAAGGLGAALFGSLAAFGEAESVIAITNAQIERTGQIANVSADDVQALSSRVQSYSGISDEAVTAGQNVLLTFKNVRNEIGEGNDVFDRTVNLGADLTKIFGGDLVGASRQLGLALEDPATGLTRLRRTGVSFTEAQKETILALQESGDLLGAQTALLDIVEGQVGDAAEAYGQTLPGQLDRAKNALGDVSEVVGQAAAAIVGPLLGGVTALAEGFFDLPEPVQNVIGALVAFGLAAGTAAAAATALRAALASNAISSALGPIAPAAQNAATALAANAKAIVTLIASNPYLAAAALAAIGAGLLIASGEADQFQSAMGDVLSEVRELGQATVGPVLSDTLSGFAGLAEILADVLNALGEQISEVTSEVDSGEDSWFSWGDAIKDTVEAVLESIPIIGQFVQIGTALNDVFNEFKGETFAKGLADITDESERAKDEQAELDARMQQIAATLPTVADAFGQVQSAAPGLEEAFGIVNASSDPSILAANLQAQADLLNTYFTDLSTIADAGFEGLAGTLQEIGPEAAGLAAQLAAALESGDLTEAARLTNAISNLEDAKDRITGLGSETGSGFTGGVGDAISEGAGAVSAAASSAGDAAAQGLGSGLSVAASLASAAMTLASVSVLASGPLLNSSATGVGSRAGAEFGRAMISVAPPLASTAMSVAGIAIVGAAPIGTARSAGLGVGRAFGQGLVSGVGEYTDDAERAARELVSSAAAAARAEAAVASPSRVFAEIGGQIAEGLAVGIEAGTSRVVDAQKKMVLAATPSLSAIEVDTSGAGAAVAGLAGGGSSIVFQRGAIYLVFHGPADKDTVADGVASGIGRVLGGRADSFDTAYA